MLKASQSMPKINAVQNHLKQKNVTYCDTSRTSLEHEVLGLNTSFALCGEITSTYHLGAGLFYCDFLL